MTTDPAWWKEAVVYQIYPSSFNDSDGDGTGDIPGIVAKLDYLEALGVDVVWLNPVYESPNVDNGYDIADYRAIMDEYGSMADWERLLAGLHDRDMKLVMDLVVNHTSDQHAWFQRALDDPEGEYRDYYVWKEGDPEEPPNNWESGFGGPAWAYDDASGEWYLHLFDERQPDLNWENPAVREEVFDLMEFWLEKGIDGFRMDVINLISKPQAFPDGDPGEGWVGSEHFADGPRVHEYLSEMYDRVLADRDVMTVGECIDVDPSEAKEYTLPDGDGLSMVFHFDHVTLDFHEEEGWWEIDDWQLSELKSIFDTWQAELEGESWNSVYLGNHDWPRIVSRFGDDEQYRRESAKLMGTFLLTFQGTPYVFQGDEIGMTNYPFESLAELRDADARNRVQRKLDAGEIEEFSEVQELIQYRCRDNARTPMQWDDSENAGFTDGDPWIGINPDYEEVNVAAARADPDSVWHHYRDLIALRDERDVLVYGDYENLTPDHERLWAYTRGDDAVLVVLNWSDEPATYAVPEKVPFDDPTVLVESHDAGVPEDRALSLAPYESRVYELA